MFLLMRQDDNGNRFLMGRYPTRAEAEAEAEVFEARGHKQLYWVEPDPDAVPPTRVVVGGAVLRGGRVLAARRSRPAELAGRWEFPGGKVEPGEGPAQALERELREELAVSARAVAPVPGAWPVRPGLELQIWTAELGDGEEPVALDDHDELRWLRAEELDEVDWLPQDRFALAAVAELLRAGAL